MFAFSFLAIAFFLGYLPLGMGDAMARGFILALIATGVERFPEPVLIIFWYHWLLPALHSHVALDVDLFGSEGKQCIYFCVDWEPVHWWPG